VSETEKSSSYWADAMASDGFVVECSRSPEGEKFGIILPEGERFQVVTTDNAVRLALLYEHDLDAYVPITEASLRTRLTHVGMPVDVMDAKIQLARTVSEAVAKIMGPIVRLADL
jgi:hypothetical protein